MAYEAKPGDGGLFKNKHKEDGDNKPNATGYVIAHRNIKEGETIRLAAWTRESETVGRWQSLKLSNDDRRADLEREQPAAPTDEEIPF